jgi:hypothetical protein
MKERRTSDWKVYEPVVQYFEQHDLGDKLSSRDPVSAKVMVVRSTLVVTVDRDSARRISQIARKKRTSSAKLLREWMKEKLLEQSVA